MSTEQGFYRGRHFTTYVDEVKQLKRDGELDKAKSLLLALNPVAEAEAKVMGWGAPPWYEEQLGIVRRRMARLQSATRGAVGMTTQQPNQTPPATPPPPPPPPPRDPPPGYEERGRPRPSPR